MGSRPLSVLLPLLLAATSRADGQSGIEGLRVRAGAEATAALTGADPVPGGGTLSEARLIRPMAMLEVSSRSEQWRLHGMLNFEGWTVPRGELTLGAWGEGFIDRRHPHTFVHELVLTGTDLLGGRDGSGRLSMSLGKGMVPFGTDDPGGRPVLRFPINHHYSQILERAVVAAGYRWKTLEAEAALFNGDEPESPWQWPRLSNRFGDSWSLRLTLRPAAGLSWQASRASVASPEHRPGSGLVQSKWSVAARYERATPGFAYALVEWAATTEASQLPAFHTFLAEAAVALGPGRPYYRFERTDRPEEIRASSPFRTLRPKRDNSILGVSSWTVHTLGISADLPWPSGTVTLQPLLEGSYGRISAEPGLFDPSHYYGRESFWSLTAGLRLGLGAMRQVHRMGSYDEPHQPHGGMEGTEH